MVTHKLNKWMIFNLNFNAFYEKKSPIKHA